MLARYDEIQGRGEALMCYTPEGAARPGAWLRCRGADRNFSSFFPIVKYYTIFANVLACDFFFFFLEYCIVNLAFLCIVIGFRISVLTYVRM